MIDPLFKDNSHRNQDVNFNGGGALQLFTRGVQNTVKKWAQSDLSFCQNMGGGQKI